MSRIVLTGDSHLGALKHAQDLKQDSRIAGLEFQPLGNGFVSLLDFFTANSVEKSVKVTHSKWNNLIFSEKELNKDEDFQLLAVSLPINSSRILRDVSWQRHVPWKFKKRRREIPISDGLIETIIEQDCSKSIAFIKAITLTGIKVFAIEGPRFFEHAPYLKRKRIEVCADIEQRYRSYASQKLADVGIGVIEQPTQTITKIGTTHHDYRHPDPRDEHHGNALYGHLVCDAIVDYADCLK